MYNEKMGSHEVDNSTIHEERFVYVTKRGVSEKLSSSKSNNLFI